jgi:potassium-transporting ATPase ATP-binding subunit
VSLQPGEVKYADTGTGPAPQAVAAAMSGAADVQPLLLVRRESDLQTAPPPAGGHEPGLLRAACKQALLGLRPDPGRPLLLLVELSVLLGLVLSLAALAGGVAGGWVACLLALDGCAALVVFAAAFRRALAEVREHAPPAAGRKPGAAIAAFRLCKVGEAEPLLRSLAATGGHPGPAAPDYYEVEETVSACLRPGDLVLVEAGQLIPGDGKIVAGAASIDESAFTGESAPVLREAGGDDPTVRGGTRLVSGRIIVSVTGSPAHLSEPG